MVQQYADASSLMGDANVDMQAIQDMARGEYSKVRESMPRDYVTMYHPDGTTSIVQLPPAGKNGKGVKDRQQKIMHFVLNKRRSVKQPDGQFKTVQWWYPSKPAHWAPDPLPWRCPVQGCMRAGGLPDLLNLYRHIHQKHPGEVELYEGVIKAIKVKLAEAIPADLTNLLNESGETAPIIKAEDIAAAKFEDAEAILSEPAVAPDTFDERHDCADCGWVNEKNTAQGLDVHKRRWCKKEG